MSSVEVLFIGLDLLCKLKHANQTEIFSQLEIFKMARNAFCYLSKMRSALDSWDTMSYWHHSYSDSIALELDTILAFKKITKSGDRHTYKRTMFELGRVRLFYFIATTKTSIYLLI